MVAKGEVLKQTRDTDAAVTVPGLAVGPLFVHKVNRVDAVAGLWACLARLAAALKQFVLLYTHHQ